MLQSSGARTAANGLRSFSTSTRSSNAKLRIGYVPEHFSTPLAFAQKHFSLNAELIPFPTGTGALASSLKAPRNESGSIDVAIGLTEGFVADLGKTRAASEEPKYGLVGTYVESPLCWAISTGAQRDDIKGVSDLREKRVGVSRIGSGSYVMSFVLADQRGWLSELSSSGDKAPEPFKVHPIGDFAALRKSVGPDRSTEFFMWEHFTTKHYWDNGELKRIGEIYTPWPSWMITARIHENLEAEVDEVLEKINDGVRYYRDHKEEAVEYITSTMRYSKEDTLEWMKTVVFADDVRGVEARTVDRTAAILRKAGVLMDEAGGSEDMIFIEREGKEEVSNPVDV